VLNILGAGFIYFLSSMREPGRLIIPRRRHGKITEMLLAAMRSIHEACLVCPPRP